MTTLPVRVARKTSEAQDIVGFELVAVDGAALPVFTAGAHIDVPLPRGLVRFSTDHAMQKGWGMAGIRARLVRPRVLIYGALLALIVAAFSAALVLRTPLKVDVMRDRGAMGRELEDGSIENVYRLQVMNTSERRHVFRITVSGLAGAHLMTPELAEFDGASARALPVRVRVPQGAGKPGSNKISFTVRADDQPSLAVTEHAVFLVPK